MTKIFKYFESNVIDIPLPERFTFPFYYDPHPLALVAAQELQKKLSNQSHFTHDFGIDNEGGVGKMFGVLVVKNNKGELGYIAAFSGMMSSKTVIDGFAPPLYDVLDPQSYSYQETQELDKLNKKINHLENNPELHKSKLEYKLLESKYQNKLSALKSKQKEDKKKRKEARNAQKNISEEGSKKLIERHKQESLNAQFLLQEYGEYIEQTLSAARDKLLILSYKLDTLKKERKTRSIALQQWLFAQYNFLNIQGERRNVIDIFRTRVIDVPPSGTGDCAAPKMLQYAFTEGMTPIAMAEFWWGKSPKSEIRKHGNFYPACKGKCEPILTHMLQGMLIDPNPLLTNPAKGKSISIVYEDQHLLVINKPAEFLSVPGIHITDSVQERMKKKYPTATGPMIAHRLDMSTSGLLVLGKTKEIYIQLQSQFSKRTVKKRYVAVLDGEVEEEFGYVDLPLILDIDNRPYQKVCFESGKSARTKWELIRKEDGKSRVYFYPITGRTHQLRVHAAHPKGLNTPIIGDDLYGTKSDRLYLHAESIAFIHPVTKKTISISCDPDF